MEKKNKPIHPNSMANLIPIRKGQSSFRKGKTKEYSKLIRLDAAQRRVGSVLSNNIAYLTLLDVIEKVGAEKVITIDADGDSSAMTKMDLAIKRMFDIVINGSPGNAILAFSIISSTLSKGVELQHMIESRQLPENQQQNNIPTFVIQQHADTDGGADKPEQKTA